jgi:predicted Zn-dependent peptidase
MKGKPYLRLVLVAVLALVVAMSACTPKGKQRSTTEQVAPHPLAQSLQAVPEQPIPMYVKAHGEDMVTLHLLLKQGYVPQRTPGLEALTLEAMLHCGAGGVAPHTWRAQLEQYGIALSTAVGPDYALIQLQAPERYWLKGWTLLQEALFYPDFDAQAYLAFRDRYAAALQARQQDEALQGYMAAMQALYGKGHPYAVSPEGAYAAISQMPVDSVVAYHSRMLQARRTLLVVAGDVKTEVVLPLVGDFAAGLKPATGKADAVDAPEWTETTVQFSETAPKRPCTVTAFLPPPPSRAGDAAAYLLALEAFRLRMSEDLCHQRYLACDLFAEWVPWQAGHVRVGFHSQQTYAAIRALVGLFQRSLTDPFTAQELATAHKQYQAQLFARTQTSAGMAAWLSAAVSRAQLERLLAILQSMDTVTPEQVLKVWQKQTTHIRWHYYGPPKQVNAKAFDRK